MAKTLSDAILRVRTNLDETTPADWTDLEITREINLGYHKIYTAVISMFENYYLKTGMFNLVANQQEYTTTDGIPSNIYKIMRVEIDYNAGTDNSAPARAIYAPLEQILTSIDNITPGISVLTSPAYYYFQDTIGILPVPTTNVTAGGKIWYVQVVTDLVNTTDVINIPYADRYYTIICKLAAGNLLRKGQQDEAIAARYIAEVEGDIELMKQELKERVSDGPNLVIDTQGEDTEFTTFGF